MPAGVSGLSDQLHRQGVANRGQAAATLIVPVASVQISNICRWCEARKLNCESQRDFTATGIGNVATTERQDSGGQPFNVQRYCPARFGQLLPGPRKGEKPFISVNEVAEACLPTGGPGPAGCGAEYHAGTRCV